MSRMHRDLKYRELSAWVNQAVFQFDVQLEPPDIAEVGRVFKENFERLTALTSLPVGLVSVAMRTQFAFDLAHFKLHGRVERSDVDDAPETQTRILNEANGMLRMGEAFQRRPPPGMTIAQADATRVDEVARQLAAANDGIDALYSSVVLSSWTLFESLATDLWVAAVNVEPKLSALSGSKNRISLMSEKKRGASGKKTQKQQDEPKTDEKVSLADIHRITKGDFKLDRKMGLLLRENFEFDSLEKIRVAYSRAFGKESGAVDEVLSDPALDRLSSVRNLIAHRAGFCDHEYCARLRYVPGLPSAKPGERVSLDGKMIAQMMNEVVSLGARLLSNVTNWVRIQ
jgi:hypothetical protein